MSFVVNKHRLVEEDSLEAAIWYEKQRDGLGEDFLSKVDRAAVALEQRAPHYRIRFSDVRRALIHRLLILSIFHGRRHPRALEERVASRAPIE